MFIRSCEAKWAIVEYARSLDFKTVVDVMPAWYMENFTIPPLQDLFGAFPFRPDVEGYYTMRYPPWGPDEDCKSFSSSSIMFENKLSKFEDTFYSTY